MKKQTQIIIILMGVIFFVLSGCNTGETGKPGEDNTLTASDSQSSVSKDSQSPKETTPEPEKIKSGDIGVVKVKFKKDADCHWKYQVVFVIKNNGPDAIWFDGGAEWDCMGGTITHTGSSMRGPWRLKANEQNEFAECLNITPCSPMPAFLDVTCKVATTKDYHDPNQINNEWKGRVSVPF